MSTESELSALQEKISQALALKARAEVGKENAQAALLAARTTLKEEFGVSTNEEAKSILAQLETALEESIEGVKSALQESGAL